MLEFLKLQEDDLEEYLQVKINAFEEDVKKYGFGPSGFNDMDVLKENRIKFPHYKMVLDGKIVGGMTCREEEKDVFWLSGIYIGKAYQNREIGAKAISFLEREYPNAKVWRLDTPYLSYRNHHFYEKMGYRKIGETEPVKEKNNFHLFLYEKTMDR